MIALVMEVNSFMTALESSSVLEVNSFMKTIEKGDKIILPTGYEAKVDGNQLRG